MALAEREFPGVFENPTLGTSLPTLRRIWRRELPEGYILAFRRCCDSIADLGLHDSAGCPCGRFPEALRGGETRLRLARDSAKAGAESFDGADPTRPFSQGSSENRTNLRCRSFRLRFVRP